ncbi:uncharacterized protein [Euphorbia lathyris]|uniref:uncharacterized protein n=1 Tax=Euphorbia lathyris TaxID=212925 RepID=UPI00331350F4
MNTVMPGIEHRFCVRHMWENMKLQFKGTEYKNLLWRAAGAGTERSWELHMQAIKNLDESAYNWVIKHDPKTWARCHFSTHTKSDALQNNICESFNAYIKLARNLPVLAMFEWIRKRIMKRYHIKSEGMKRYKGDICPAIQEQLEKLKIEARNCFCTAVGQDKYSVDCCDTTSVVDLGARTCSCRLWQLSGVPCKHVISAIYTNRERPESYVDRYFSKDVYLGEYSHVINPIPGPEEWVRTELPNIHPWVVKKPSGRPKKKRNRQADEPHNPFKVTRAGGKILCGRCKMEGHNSRGCKAAITGETA